MIDALLLVLKFNVCIVGADGAKLNITLYKAIVINRKLISLIYVSSFRYNNNYNWNETLELGLPVMDVILLDKTMTASRKQNGGNFDIFVCTFLIFIKVSFSFRLSVPLYCIVLWWFNFNVLYLDFIRFLSYFSFTNTYLISSLRVKHWHSQTCNLKMPKPSTMSYSI